MRSNTLNDGKYKYEQANIFQYPSCYGSICGFFALLLFAISIPRKEIISIENVDYIYDKLSFHMFFLEPI